MAENVPTELQKSITKVRESLASRSFSGRNPELGKMINCVFCDRRHRSIENCVQRFAKDKNGKELIAEGHGHGKGRLTPHWNRRSLELVILTRRLIPLYPEDTPIKKIRSRALNLLRKKWHAASQRIQAQQKLSRRINRCQ